VGLAGHQETMGEGGKGDTKESTTHHITRVVLVVAYPGEAGEEGEEHTAHLYEGLDQPEVLGPGPVTHPVLEVEDAEGHGVGGEGGVPGDEAQPGVLYSLQPVRPLDCRVPQTGEVCDI